MLSLLLFVFKISNILVAVSCRQGQEIVSHVKGKVYEKKDET